MTLDPKQTAIWIRDLEERLSDQPLSVVRREPDWVFCFGNSVALCVECFWRFRDHQGLLLTSKDDGQKFGLPAPIDAENKANSIIASSNVTSITIDPVIADIRLVLANGITCEILTDSSGYESWQAYDAEPGGELLGVGANGGLI